MQILVKQTTFTAQLVLPPPLYTFFYKEHEAQFSQNLRTVLASTEEQTLKFSVKEQVFAVDVVYKIKQVLQISKLLFASCLLMYSCFSQQCKDKTSDSTS